MDIRFKKLKSQIQNGLSESILPVGKSKVREKGCAYKY